MIGYFERVWSEMNRPGFLAGSRSYALYCILHQQPKAPWHVRLVAEAAFIIPAALFVVLFVFIFYLLR